MCLDQQRSALISDLDQSRIRSVNGNVVVQLLRNRLAETEARLERARARELELSRRLEDMKRFVAVMEVLESYLKRVFLQRQSQIMDRISSMRKV
ncbi:hypothetical protein ACHQM5_016352 [Ranunculus cassubicifolius]